MTWITVTVMCVPEGNIYVLFVVFTSCPLSGCVLFLLVIGLSLPCLIAVSDYPNFS
jgi:hypothetical protein